MSLGIVRKLCSVFVADYCKRHKSVNAKMNVFTQKRNPLTGATEWDMQHEDYDYHQEIARSAFADMLHDTERNKKYHRALQLAIDKMHNAGKPANVLDIGTGTGLLSIMAARCGADTIVACEAFQPMAECCLKILRQNGVADKVTVIPKRSTELTVGEDGDMKHKANILVTEVFDTELIGEGALSTFSHAHKYLLDEDCIVIPDSAIIYIQVVDCAVMQKWNKLDDIKDDALNLHLKTPEKMKKCAGSAAVHDVQLSQLSRRTFTELSEQLPVFYYDWSGRSGLDMKRTVKQMFVATGTGNAQMVFMWWELNMDTEGRIVLSCAPWWNHPAAKVSAEYPQDTIPWRDHWMQAIYYFPTPLPVKNSSEYTIICCQDEYSLWFYLEDDIHKSQNYLRPICECGVHMAFSRTHVAFLNDKARTNMLLKEIKKQLKEVMSPVVLDLNGSSLLGLCSAKIGANKVYVLESSNLDSRILQDYVKENGLTNVHFVPELTEDVLREVSIVVCDPSFNSSILPWENLKVAYTLCKVRDKLRHDTVVLPEKFELFAMPAEFLDLHKIRIPLGKCEGIDMKAFDELVESSRQISDADIEAQPLWEYPCYCRGTTRKLLEVDMLDLKNTYANNESYELAAAQEGAVVVNGFAIWAEWSVGPSRYSSGPSAEPRLNQRVTWDSTTRQAVKLLKNTYQMKSSDEWSYQVACDLTTGQFNLSLDLLSTNHKAVSKLFKMSAV